MLTLKKLLKITDGRLLNNERSVCIQGVSIDSRTIKKNEVFIAIEGKHFDGHHFIRDAEKKGASLIISSRKISHINFVPVIYVHDTTKALGHIASFYRDQFSVPVIAVTGSAGKTTVKEMIASVLASKFNVLKNVNTENNQYGVPLTLLKLKKFHNLVVLELGTNQFGDMDWLAQIAKPTMAVFTNIGPSHLKGLNSPRGVFTEKFQLVKHMPPQGTIIFNGDDHYLKSIALERLTQKSIIYSTKNKSEFQAKEITLQNDRQIHFDLVNKNFSLNTPFEHNVYNALAAICCGRQFFISYNTMKEILSRFKFSNGRQEVHRIGSMLLINDTYNSNPLSLRSAIQTLDSLKNKGRKILICADMLELGHRAIEMHKSIGKVIAGTSIDFVLTLGELSKYISSNLRKFSRTKESFHFGSQKEIQNFLEDFCRPGDIFLVKGSRSMLMEQTAEYLRIFMRFKEISKD